MVLPPPLVYPCLHPLPRGRLLLLTMATDVAPPLHCCSGKTYVTLSRKRNGLGEMRSVCFGSLPAVFGRWHVCRGRTLDYFYETELRPPRVLLFKRSFDVQYHTATRRFSNECLQQYCTPPSVAAFSNNLEIFTLLSSVKPAPARLTRTYGCGCPVV